KTKTRSSPYRIGSRPTRRMTTVPSTILWLPFVAAVVVFLFRDRGRNVAAWLMTCTALASLALTLSLYPAIAASEVLRQSYAWAPSLGLAFTVRVDGFSWLLDRKSTRLNS